MPKSDRYYLPLHRSGDTPRMTEAVTWAEKAGLDPLYRPHPAQLKFGPVNFWPNTGKIYVDGQKRCTDHGLDAFKAAAHDYYILPHMTLAEGVLRLAEHNGLSLDAFRYESLDGFFALAERAPFRRAA